MRASRCFLRKLVSEMTGAQKKTHVMLMDSRKIDEYEMTGEQKKTHAYKLMDSQKTREYEATGEQKKTHAYKLMDSQKTREYEVTGAQKIDDEYEPMDSQKTREYEVTGAQKTDVYELMDSQKTREYNMKGRQKTDEYEITGALNPCKQTKKVKNPCVQNSSCVEVRKNDGFEIIHNCQRERACQDVDVKPVVRDPVDDDRVLVESGAEMTRVPHEPSELKKNRNTISLTSHFNHGAHHASKAKHKRNHTSEQSASSKTANSQ